VDDASQQTSNEQLARSAQAGDWAGFEELVRRFEHRIYRFVLSGCAGHPADARELAQETFVSAFQHLHRFDPSRSFATWLFTIARRKCIDRNRRPRREFERELPELSDTDDPSVLAARRDAANDLWRTARRVLSDTQYQTLWLHYAEDLSVREVARVMRRLPPHVKVTLFRARKALARELNRLAALERIEPEVTTRPQKTAAAPAAVLAAPASNRA
jgi:RNA polymerase sigma-70 factor (ECF subfamily)